ncbi:MAG: RNA-binding protein [Simkaniaceae bacterium]|nr:RNA-binding protein [Simkaniaceae bacterium]
MKLFVGNIPYATTEDELKELCAEFNPISVKLVIDRETGRSKGFGFVEFGNKADGEKAKEALSGLDVNGKALVVDEARPRQPR